MRRSNQNPEEKISIAVPDWFKINRIYYTFSGNEEIFAVSKLFVDIRKECP